MRQRNDTHHAWTFAAQPAVPATDDHPAQPETDAFAVQPGEVIDRPNLLDGWTEVDDEPPAVSDTPPAKTAATQKKRAAAGTDTDGGEPQ